MFFSGHADYSRGWEEKGHPHQIWKNVDKNLLESEAVWFPRPHCPGIPFLVLDKYAN